MWPIREKCQCGSTEYNPGFVPRHGTTLIYLICDEATISDLLPQVGSEQKVTLTLGNLRDYDEYLCLRKSFTAHLLASRLCSLHIYELCLSMVVLIRWPSSTCRGSTHPLFMPISCRSCMALRTLL